MDQPSGHSITCAPTASLGRGSLNCAGQLDGLSMSEAMKLLKSKVLSGRQCKKKLWLEVQDPNQHPVGELAQRLFPGAVLKRRS